MANTFGILAALVLLLSTFVAFKNKNDLQTQIEVTETEQARNETNTKTINDLVATIDDRNAEIASETASRDDLQGKLKEQSAALKELKDTITEKETDLNETKERVTKAEDKLKELGPLEELASEIETLKAEIAQLEDESAILKAQTSRLSGEERTVSVQSTTLSKILSDRTSGRSLPSLDTRIANVSRSLGFVTLAAGDNAGVVSGSKLDVKNGNETIAQLTVTAVSSNTATADIITSSVKEGESVSPGDRVVASPEAAPAK